MNRCKTYVNLKGTTLSERSQFQKVTYYVIPSMRHYRNGEKIGGFQVLGKRGFGYKRKHNAVFSDDKTILYPVCSDGYKHFLKCVKTYRTVYQKSKFLYVIFFMIEMLKNFKKCEVTRFYFHIFFPHILSFKSLTSDLISLTSEI